MQDKITRRALLTRRALFAALPAALLPTPADAAGLGLLSQRMHVLARYSCRRGGTLSLVLRGQPYKLTQRERGLCTQVAQQMDAAADIP